MSDSPRLYWEVSSEAVGLCLRLATRKTVKTIGLLSGLWTSYEIAVQLLAQFSQQSPLPSPAAAIATALSHIGWWWVFLLSGAMASVFFVLAETKERRIRNLDWKTRLATNGQWKQRPWWRRPPIRWADYEHFLSYTVGVPMADGRRPLRIEGFRLHGENTSKTRALRITDASIRSLVSGERIRAHLEGARYASEVNIRPAANFKIVAPFMSDGMTANEFRSRFSYFKLVVATDAGLFEQEFEREDVDAFLLSLIPMTEWTLPGERQRFDAAA